MCMHMSLYFTFESKHNTYRTIKVGHSHRISTVKLFYCYFQLYLDKYRHGVSYMKFYIYNVNTEDTGVLVHSEEQCGLYFITCM